LAGIILVVAIFGSHLVYPPRVWAVSISLYRFYQSLR